MTKAAVTVLPGEPGLPGQGGTAHPRPFRSCPQPSCPGSAAPAAGWAPRLSPGPLQLSPAPPSPGAGPGGAAAAAGCGGAADGAGGAAPAAPGMCGRDGEEPRGRSGVAPGPGGGGDAGGDGGGGSCAGGSRVSSDEPEPAGSRSAAGGGCGSAGGTRHGHTALGTAPGPGAPRCAPRPLGHSRALAPRSRVRAHKAVTPVHTHLREPWHTHHTRATPNAPGLSPAHSHVVGHTPYTRFTHAHPQQAAV